MGDGEPPLRVEGAPTSRSLATSTMWSMAGQFLPLLAAPMAIPVLIHGYGIDRFGIIALAWTLTGSASLFDLGMSRAVAKFASERIGQDVSESVRLAWTALILAAFTGLVGMALLVATAAPLSEQVLHIPASMRSETERSFIIIALSIPLITSAAALRGLLEAHQRFRLVNAVRIPMGVLAFVGPCAALVVGPHLEAAVASLLLARVLPLVAYLRHTVWVIEGIGLPKPDLSLVPPLLAFGGWVTVANIVVPIVAYSDRFIIGAVLSISAVAYYAACAELASKLALLPSAVVSVLFPAFAGGNRIDRRRTVALFEIGTKVVFGSLTPPVLALLLFAKDGMAVWLGADFASHSYMVLQLLAVGGLLNALAYIPSVFLQAVGRPKWTALNSLVQLPLYAVFMYIMCKYKGIEGAALAAAVRFGVDACVLFALALWTFGAKLNLRTDILAGLATLSAACVIAIWPSQIGLKVPVLLVLWSTTGAVIWGVILRSPERAALLRAVAPLRGANRV